MSSIISICKSAPMIPVITINNIEDAVPLATALYKGGLTVLEVTLRTPVAIEAIQKISNELPEAIVGAGTILNPAQLESCIKAGAKFGVSPGTTSELISAVREHDFPFLPGCATPSEAMFLLSEGFKTLKFFPAGSIGGAPTLKAISAPLSDLTFCPTGGISLSNAEDYLSLKSVLTVGGSWVCPDNLIKDKKWNEITILAAETVQRLSSI